MVVGEVRVVEPIWVIGRLVSSPIKTSSELVYEEWRERCPRSVVIWWEPPLSRGHDRGVVVVVMVVVMLGHGCHGARVVDVKAKEEEVNHIVVDWKKRAPICLVALRVIQLLVSKVWPRWRMASLGFRCNWWWCATEKEQ